MKRTLLSVFVVAVLSIGLTGSAFAQVGRCFNNPSKACQDANKAFAKHHGGVYPEQYFNSWYGGNRGRWYQQDNDWRWEGANGDRYWNGAHGWERHRHHHHDRDDD